jgi:hypothetical protein
MLTLSLVCLLSAGDPAFAQQTPASVSSPATTPASTPEVAKPSAPPPPNTLLDGTMVKLRLAETISSETAKTGQQVPFEVVEEVDVQGVPVLLKGAAAVATVTDAQPKRRMGRGGKLDVNVDSARLVDGEKVQLRAVKDTKGGGHVEIMTGAMVATAIVFFPAAPLFLFMRGKEITIPKGTEITAFVQGDMRLDMAKMVAPEPLVPGPAVPGAAGGSGAVVALMASVTVDSSITGADIEVDGAFVGSTPSTVSVTSGQHTILVKKKGYADWSRTMNVAGSGVRVSADLEARP